MVCVASLLPVLSTKKNWEPIYWLVKYNLDVTLNNERMIEGHDYMNHLYRAEWGTWYIVLKTVGGWGSL